MGGGAGRAWPDDEGEDVRYRAALLGALIESAPMAILAVSPQRRVLAANRRFEQLWGLAEGSVRVGGPSPALLAESRAQVLDPAAFEGALRWGHAHPAEQQRLDVPLVDGRVIEGVAAPIFDHGEYRGRIWFLTDDTERRAVEVERAALLDEVQSAQQSQAFLLQAARVLAGASNYTETLDRLAAVAVPTLGDLCLIDVVSDDGGVRRMAARHADPTRQSLVDELERRYPPDPGGAHPSIEVIRTGRSRWSATMSEEFLRSTCRSETHYELTRALEFTSYMTVPLVAADAVLGAVTIVSAGSGRVFGPDHLALAEELAAQVAEVVAKARQYDQEHLMAHTLQASLLPAVLPEVAGVQVVARYLASTRGAEVGGDWYDVLSLGSGLGGLAVGDVAGHDLGAAAAMGQVRSAGRALAGHATGPAGLLDLLHDSWDQLGIDRMATCVVAQVDPGTGELTIASAGHPPPLLVAGGTATYLPVEPGPPLGAPRVASDEWRGTLPPGAVLLMYTDGLIDERGLDLDDGLARLAAVAAGAGGPADVCERVLSALAAGSDDDVAVLAFARSVVE